MKKIIIALATVFGIYCIVEALPRMLHLVDHDGSMFVPDSIAMIMFLMCYSVLLASN